MFALYCTLFFSLLSSSSSPSTYFLASIAHIFLLKLVKIYGKTDHRHGFQLEHMQPYLFVVSVRSGKEINIYSEIGEAIK